MIFQAYMDESGTHGAAPVMVMGAYIAPAISWRKLETRWSRLLADNRLDYFHSKEMRANWSYPAMQLFVEDAQEVVRQIKSPTHFGIVTILRKTEYLDHYLEGKRGGPFDSQYGLCFRMTMFEILKWFSKKHDDNDIGTPAIFPILESGHTNSGDAERIYHSLRKHLEPRYSRMLGPIIGFADKQDCAGVQVADLVSNIHWKSEETHHKRHTIPRLEKSEGVKTGAIQRLLIAPDGLKRARARVLTRKQQPSPAVEGFA